MDGLNALVPARLHGGEVFTQGGRSLGANVLGFWSWACSDLVGNAMRGVLAEYIVGTALGCVDGRARREWDACDLITDDGLKIEVKSSAYLQTWEQKRLSSITFSILPTNGWDAATNTISTERRRQADVYVFCVLEHRDKRTVDPLDLDQWAFYVLSTRRLNETVGDQKTLSLSRLLQLDPTHVSYTGIREAVQAARH